MRWTTHELGVVSAFLTPGSCSSLSSAHRGVGIPSRRNGFADSAGAGTAPKPRARGWADRNISQEATSFWFYTTIGTSRQGICLQKLVNSMEKGLFLQQLMNRKSWKIRINCHENCNTFKRFFYTGDFGVLWIFLFYFMSVAIIRNCSAWMRVFYFKIF